MKMDPSEQQIIADFFAQGYRFSGAFVGGHRSLPDVIYDPRTAFVLVKDAYLSPVVDPAKISTYYASAVLAKENLDFVLTISQKDGLRLDQRYVMGNYSYNLSVSVPFFEIHGRLQTSSHSFDPRLFLSSEVGAYITLLDATARCTFNPEIAYEGGTALISRTQVSFIGEIKREED